MNLDLGFKQKEVQTSFNLFYEGSQIKKIKQALKSAIALNMVATVFDFIYAFGFLTLLSDRMTYIRLALVGATEGLVAGFCLYLVNRYKLRNWHSAMLFSLVMIFSIGYNELRISGFAEGVTQIETLQVASEEFWRAFRYLEYILIFIIMAPDWKLRSIIIFANVIYLGVRYPGNYINTELILQAVFLSFIICGFFYFAEKREKKVFLNQYAVFEKEAMWKEMLNMIPQGILFLGKEEEIIYSNDGVSKLFDVEATKDKLTQAVHEANIVDIAQGYTSHIAKKIQKIVKTNFRRVLTNNDDNPTDTTQLMQKKFEKKYICKRFSINNNNATTDISTKKVDESPNRAELLLEKEDAPEDFSNMTKASMLFKERDENSQWKHRVEFETKMYKGYAANPMISEDFLVFVMYYERFDITDGRRESSGKKFSIEVKYQEILTQTNDLTKMIVISDITDRDKLINLEESDRYKNLMMASVSHELRTPLNGVISMIQSAMETYDDDDDLKQSYLIPALNSSKILMYLINDILDWSQLNAKKLKISQTAFNLRKKIEEIFQLFVGQMELKKLIMTSQINESIDFIKTDPNRLSQILLNLIGNALKFTFSGEIKLRVEKDAMNPGVVKFSVQDTGIGIKDSDLPKLFKLFGKLDQGEKVTINSTGVGLGLTISNSLALLLGPDSDDAGIKVVSKFGQGSTFSFKIKDLSFFEEHAEDTSMPRLPTEEPEDQKNPHKNFINKVVGMKRLAAVDTAPVNKNVSALITSRTKEAKEPKGCECVKILIVDDMPYNILALKTMLKSLGYETEGTNNGEIAVNQILAATKNRQCCGGYKIIFMDCNMPVMDGYEATMELRKMEANGLLGELKIIGCTAYSAKDMLNKCLECGMDEYVVKPISKMRLKELCDQYLGEK